jgi:uncharacterized protein (TIGR03000 family)
MYAIVLAAFLTTGNEIPDFGRRGGCWGGCRGCWGGCYGGCYGWGGCWGGCYGGCWGGCYGGCWGCYGCGGCGGVVVYPASGGGCTGMSSSGGSSARGGGCTGMSSGGGSSTRGAAGSSQAQSGGSTEMAQTLQELKQSLEELKKEQNKLRLEALKQTAEQLKLKATEEKIDELRRNIEELRKRMPPPAAVPPGRPRPELPAPEPGKGQVLLEMPADALVLVNDKRIDAATFLTPALQPGQEYDVHVEAAVVRDGKTINRVKNLQIQAGEVVRLAYKDMEPAESRWTRTGQKVAAPAHITVRLPADARLNVHGVDCPLTSDTREFDTPALTPGKKYSYSLRAEVIREGRPVAQTRRITFRSGERVLVSFEDLDVRSLTAR